MNFLNKIIKSILKIRYVNLLLLDSNSNGVLFFWFFILNNFFININLDKVDYV